MRSEEDRRSRAQARVIAALEEVTGRKLDWKALSEDIKSKTELYLEEFSQKPEVRMRKTMEVVAAITGMRWAANSPSDHPYKARLDG
jgi:hypothetical protein